MKPTFVALTLLLAAGCADAPAAEQTARSEAPARTAVVAGSPAAGTAPVGALQTIALRVPDMACRLCARPIEHRLTELGVRNARANLESKWVTGRFDPQRISPEQIRTEVERIRFRVTDLRVG